MERAALIDRLRRELASREGVRLALLFGSRARGDHRPDSDVDLAVLGDADQLALGGDLSRALGIEVNLVDLRDPSMVLLREILRDGVRVHEAEPGVFGAFLSRGLTQLETDGPAFRRAADAFIRQLARVAPAGGT